MGNCRSCESRSNVTAKLILLDGQLQEFTCPVKVSHLLQLNFHSDCFICSSDQMEFNQFLVEMGGDEVLRLGELYFEVPSRWRNHRLQAEDMAALAVKANVALSSSSSSSEDDMISCGCCMSKKVNCATIVFNEKERPLLAEDGGRGWVDSPRRMGGAGGCRGAKFTTKLSVIVEDL